MGTKLFLLHRSHNSNRQDFFNHSVTIREERDTQENLERLQHAIQCLCGSSMIIRGEIIDVKVKAK